jgi:two-component system, NtrC family, response regulator
MNGGPKRRPLLIVEDDLALQKQMKWAFENNETVLANDIPTAIAHVRRFEPAVVTMDLGLPPQPNDAAAGFELLSQILTLAPNTKVIVLTGQNDHANALKAIRLGAYDFFAKPFDPELLGFAIERAFILAELQDENRRLQNSTQSTLLSKIITQDAEMQRVNRVVEKVAPTTATILLRGESGTGKELVARALHGLSPRAKERYVAINCAAIPEALLESELFGHEKGAFTGAAKQTQGKVEVAHKGTLFLDEIGDLPLALQSKMLRFLQERVIERVGGREEIPVDVRIICATHQDLKAMIAEGKFREDLYYRLAEIAIEIPPLRSRPGDASLLAHAFVRRFAEEQRRNTITLTPAAVIAIENYQWPGNVRELENCIKRAVIMADGVSIGADDLDLKVEGGENHLNLRQVRDEAERKAVNHALARADGNVSKAAEALGVSRPTLYELLERFGLR